MQFLHDDFHYLNPRFSTELGFLNKPVFEMQKKVHALNKEIGSNSSLTEKERLKLYSQKTELVAGFKRQMDKEVKKNCPELELQASYAMDVQLSDQVCNEVGKWCERQPQKNLLAAEQRASQAMQNNRINWYYQMFGKEDISQAKVAERNNPEIDFDKE